MDKRKNGFSCIEEEQFMGGGGYSKKYDMYNTNINM